LKRMLGLAALGLMLAGCGRVEIMVKDGDESFRISAPMSCIKAALRFTDDGVIELDGLGGSDAQIDLQALISELNASEGLELQMVEGDQTVQLTQQKEYYLLEVREGFDSTVEMRIPYEMVAALGRAGDSIHVAELLDSLDDFHGTLIEVRGPNEHVRIRLK